MATESPVRIVETTRAGKWVSAKDAALFGSHNLVDDELSSLLKGHKAHEDQRSMVPNRSGSAPPSMEGSYASFGNLLYSHTSSWGSTLASSSIGIEHYKPEDRLQTDSSNYILSSSNLKLNAKFTQPIMSGEGKQQVHAMGSLGNKWISKPSGVSSDGFLLLERSSLLTYHEEPEDDISPQKASQERADSSPSIMSVQDTSSMSCRGSLVDLIQADFPRTPSPVYNHSHSSSRVTSDKPIDSGIEALSLDNLSLNVSKAPGLELSLDSGAGVENSYRLKAIGDSTDTVLKTAYLDKVGSVTSPQRDAAANKDKHLGEIKVLGCQDPPSHDENKQEDEIYERNLSSQHLCYSQQHSQVQGYHDQVTCQPLNNMLSGSRKVLPGQVNFSSQPTGLTPPLYATAAYMAGNQFYSNLNPPALYAPQYSMGGYTFSSTFVPQFLTGYPSHAGLPIPVDLSSSQSFNGQTAVVSTGETSAQVGDTQHFNKFYCHPELVLHPTFSDPLQMQYLHYPLDDSLSHPSHFGGMPPGNVHGDQFDTFCGQKDSNMHGYNGDKKVLPPSNSNLSMLNPRKVGMPGTNFYSTPTSFRFVPQYPGSPLANPVIPGSPMGVENLSGRRFDPKYPQTYVRNAGAYAGLQGDRGSEGYNDSKKHSFLEELKTTNARKIDLSDIAGRIVEFSVDQHGSRFIQQKLESCSIEEKVSVFKEVLPHASKLMTDVFGNYVIQKFFEYGDPDQRKELANQLSGQMLPLSLQMYGCRVIQKALEVIDLDQKTKLVSELDGHVMRCVRDQNGNHVIQKCIECVPTENISFIISAFEGQVSTLSTHPYGCRVIQRVLEHCSFDQQTQSIIDEILESSFALAQDQYGNYVTQHVLERGKPCERSKIVRKLKGKIIQMSQHKYASNVVEKCLEYGDAAERETLVNEILAQPGENDTLLIMMKDQYANYVVQKILEISNDQQKDILLNRIRIHLHGLKKYTYGKHIVARFEQLSGEEDSGTG